MSVKLSSLQKGLVMHLPLDQESYNPATKRFSDRSAYSNHGTAANAAVFAADRMGQGNRATVYNLTNTVNCGNDQSLNIDGDITFAMWFFSDFAGARGLFSKGTPTVQGYYCMIYSGGYVSYKTNQAGARQMTDSTTSFTTDEWQHLIITRCGSVAKIYRNMIDVTGTSESHIDPLQCNNDFYAGSYKTIVKFDGKISDFRVYNRVLSAQERTLLYESYRPKVIL